MGKKICLMSGHVSTGKLKDIDRKMLAEAENRNVLVLNLSWAEANKLRAKQEFLADYFSEIGADQVEFVFPLLPSYQAERRLEDVGLVYIPGGDTETLIRNLKIFGGLVSRLRSFGGVISANSAGAYALCPEYLKIRGRETRIIPALGIVDFWVKVHYEPQFDSDLVELSDGREIYGLTECSAVVQNGERSFIGEVHRFANKQKQRVN